MRILIVGSGGREHSLVWKLAQEAEVYCTPGNAGIAEECETFDVLAIDAASVVALATKLEVDLVVVGPEDPLIAGLADTLRAAGLAVFGPGSKGARHEASKAWSKAMMVEAGVPTAESSAFTELVPALDYVRTRAETGRQVVVKASGAALGKGVVVCSSEEEARAALHSILERRELGEAGGTVVVEDRLVGSEFSLLTLVSGTGFYSLPVAQDYKRIFDADQGPNTGGMGSYSPVGWVSQDLVVETEQRVVKPMVEHMAARGIDYRGVLFSGLMVEDGRLFCLEYNVRFGDPEVQSIVRRLEAGLADALMDVAQGRPVTPVALNSNAAVTVVMASGGYPGSYEKGRPITIGEMPVGVTLFHSGTALRDGQLVTNGGRVMGVSAAAPTVGEARTLAYRGTKEISFEGAYCRSDVAIDLY